MSGLLPPRNPENRDGPVPGATADHDWQGYVPQSQMPSLFNPSDHIIVTANNQIVDDATAIYVTSIGTTATAPGASPICSTRPPR